MGVRHLLNKKGFNQLHVKELHKHFVELDGIIQHVFPNEAFIEKNLKQVQISDKNIFNKLEPYYMALHTRDDDWVTRYLAKVCEAKQLNIPYNAIKAYVACGREYDFERYKFEQRIVKSYIKLLKKFDGRETLWNTNNALDTSAENYDVLFRNKVTLAMRYLGVAEETVERTLEFYAGLWRERAKKIMYKNRYQNEQRKLVENNLTLLLDKQPANGACAQAMGELLYREWSDLYDYDYYQKHRRSIDKVHKVTPAMRMSKAQVAELRNEFDLLNQEYDFMTFILADEVKTLQAQNQTTSVDNSYWDQHQPQNNLSSYELGSFGG